MFLPKASVPSLPCLLQIPDVGIPPEHPCGCVPFRSIHGGLDRESLWPKLWDPHAQPLRARGMWDLPQDQPLEGIRLTSIRDGWVLP